jgi:hypothetical protein
MTNGKHKCFGLTPSSFLLDRAFSSPDPKRYYDAVFNLFVRFPDEDGAGVFWSAVHSIENAGCREDSLLRGGSRMIDEPSAGCRPESVIE